MAAGQPPLEAVTGEIGAGSRFWRRALWVSLVPLLLGAANLVAAAFAVDSMLLFFGVLLFCGITALAMPIALYRAWRLGPERWEALNGLFLLLVMTVASIVSMAYLSWPLHRWALARAADRASVVIDAIKRFERAEGRPPESLQELVPAYMTAVPGTGLPSYPAFEYQRFDDPGGSLLWWDLGSRHGAPMTGLWIYPDGDPDHAILALELDGRGVVATARVDRMPPTTEQLAFSPESWRKNSGQRLQMVQDLALKHDLEGKTRAPVEELLGPPSGSRVLRESPWELRIPCPAGVDVNLFLYWPTERYPKQLYGGSTQKIGKWAWVPD